MKNFGLPEATKLVKLSICACGFHLLHDDIKVGTDYTVYPTTARPDESFMLICGGCGTLQSGKGRIYARSSRNPYAFPAKLPLEIFEIGKST